MNRWNGWGDTQTEYPLPSSAAAYLKETVGTEMLFPDASLEQLLTRVPPSRLPLDAQIIVDPMERLRHAHGQSLPDWVALRSGQIDCFPDGVVFPSNNEQVCALLKLASSLGIHLIPFGGGTSVVGHVNPLPSEVPVLTIDMARFNQLQSLDERDRLATFQAGISGPQLEKILNQRGYTLGHFPQSFEKSTLGGWIATRSCGQQSYYYGRIEDLFAGGQIETPLGRIDLPALPASAAGPDLRQIVLGSEGRLGILTSASLRIHRLPEYEAFFGVFFPDWQLGIEAVREIVDERSNVSMLRLSDSDETLTTLILSGKDNLVAWARRGLSMLGIGPERSLLIFAVTGQAKTAQAATGLVAAIARSHRGLPVGKLIGNLWRKSRFSTPYLRNTLWEHGYALDTLETALSWSDLSAAATAIKKVIGSGLESSGEKILVFAHLSHVYRDGASLYVTYLFRRSAEPGETLRRWTAIKTAASQVILKYNGTISHQHGVGLDHIPYLSKEKGPLGMTMLRSLAKTVDPQQIMNPGKLYIF